MTVKRYALYKKTLYIAPSVSKIMKMELLVQVLIISITFYKIYKEEGICLLY